MKKLFALLLTAFLALGSMPAAALAQTAEAPAPITGDYVEGEAIVCVTDSPAGLYSRSAVSPLLAGAEELMPLASPSDTYSRSAGPAESLKLVRSGTLSTAELIEALRELDTVVFAEPNYLYSVTEDRAAASGTKDLTPDQWAYDKDGRFSMAVEGWNCYKSDGTPDPAVDTGGTVVAVLDSGVDYTHEDLKDVMWTADETLQAALGGGQYGYNAVAANSSGAPYDSRDPMDDNSHGTHCAGVIAGSWNHTGISGITSGAQIMAVKIGNDSGSMLSSDILKGFSYVLNAVRQGVNVTVTSNSWGGPSGGQAIDRAVTALGRDGVVSVFASGNESSDCDTASKTVSTLRDNPYAVAVNASDINGDLASFSNYGAITTDVAAPGDEILSAIPTSMGTADPRYVKSPLMNGFEGGGADTWTVDLEPGTGSTAELTGTRAFEGSQSLMLTHDSAAPVLVSQAQDLSLTPYRYLSYMLWADPTNEQSLYLINTFIEVRTTGLDSENQPVWEALTPCYGSVDSWTSASFTLPANTDYGHFQVRVYTAGQLLDNTPITPGTLYFDNFSLGDQTAAYESKSGTSMATPAVAGEAAILAKHFDDKDAAKTAARVIGSVKKIDSQAGKSVSGGLAQLDLALAGNTVPVINSAVPTGDNQLAIGGYFFGKTPTVTIDGVPAAVTASSDESIVAALPEGMTAGLKRVEVTSDKGPGHQSFELGAVSSLYERLPLPDDTRFYDSTSGSLTGLGGSLYYAGVNQSGSLEFWRYTPGAAESNGWTRLNSDPAVYPSANSACTWEGRLVIATEYDEKAGIAVYDPDTDAWTRFTTDQIAPVLNASLVNTGSEVLFIGGKTTVGNDVYSQKSIIRLDIAAQTSEKIGELSTGRVAPAVAYTGDGAVYVAGGTKAELVDGLEKIENGQSTLVRDNVLPQGLAQSQDYTGTWGTVDGGMLFSGPVVTDPGSGQVTADTYALRFDAGGFEPTGKIVSTGRVYNGVGTAYQDAFYVLGETNYAENNRVFSVDRSVKTLAQPGDKPEKPVDPVNPVTPETPDSPGAGGNASTGFVSGSAAILAAAVLLAACAAGLLLYRKQKLH
ncbi:S8 family serine peptidase [Eubacterium sp. 1001713B170207_170306_E7]|uniref:S8 family serine peptidase n=1 Tax=Eubacterium sp. 1001713B170207_170306_E7 TaxID=2787097 RepID=UPI001898615A|nr:S8 family serine peptidase [Eubacterium sp. 1001713B170207_170306_E7]